jgi:von Willebrand factor type A domain
MGDVNTVNFQSGAKPVEKAPRRSPDKPTRPEPVRRTDQRTPVVELDDGSMVVFAPGTRVTAEKAQADVCFVFDTTGSMSDKVDGLINCMSDFVDQLGDLALDWRTTCVPFGDLTVSGDRVETQLPFVKTVSDAKRQLKDMPRFSGGANSGESSIEAILAGIRKPWRPQAVCVIVLLTDEPALGTHRSQEVLAELCQHEIICFSATPDERYYRDWSAQTAGKWFLIGPSMDTRSIVTLLTSLVRDIADVAKSVHALAGGSVSRYIELTSGSSQIKKK